MGRSKMKGGHKGVRRGGRRVRNSVQVVGGQMDLWGTVRSFLGTGRKELWEGGTHSLTDTRDRSKKEVGDSQGRRDHMSRRENCGDK